MPPSHHNTCLRRKPSKVLFYNCWSDEKGTRKVNGTQCKMSYMSFLIKNSLHVVAPFCVCVHIKESSLLPRYIRSYSLRMMKWLGGSYFLAEYQTKSSFRHHRRERSKHKVNEQCVHLAACVDGQEGEMRYYFWIILYFCFLLEWNLIEVFSHVVLNDFCS